MLTINLGNVEELIFHDKELQRLLPDLVHEFRQWHLAKQNPGLRMVGRRAVIDALNKLDEHLAVLERHFDQTIVIDRLDYRVVKDVTIPINGTEDDLCGYEGFQDICISRNGEQVYICFWR